MHISLSKSLMIFFFLDLVTKGLITRLACRAILKFLINIVKLLPVYQNEYFLILSVEILRLKNKNNAANFISPSLPNKEKQTSHCLNLCIFFYC